MLIWRLYKKVKKLEEAVRWLALHELTGARMDVAPEVIKEIWESQR